MTPQEFPPTLREVMLRGRWIAVLCACLVVAGVFAFLGQWQLERAIDTDPPPAGITEEVRPLADVLEPGEYLPEPLVGQRVEVAGEWIPGDFLIVSSRFNDDAEGFWVTGQLRVAEQTSIAVALGWAPDRDSADAAADALERDAAGAEATITGRIISDEGTSLPRRDDPFGMDRMSPAMLLGQWHDTEQLSVYRPYLASVEAPTGLVDIVSPAPDELGTVNWLNIFYAIEWAVFAGFAFYIWYRLAKDRWQLEVEEFEERSGTPAP
ncbi:cytochrome oxidase assembly protein ShyY1 [Microbacterium ginsengiterrae]|uniref:SURF1-like protein n=2 Tax=Microbacterium ginsengiterrae TaxID=546115 RepID=A0A7W9CD87_9MICO|nr:cytochrome oxidase assembly protein ShyY1 [Microbacterium ginsengiterrae]